MNGGCGGRTVSGLPAPGPLAPGPPVTGVLVWDFVATTCGRVTGPCGCRFAADMLWQHGPLLGSWHKSGGRDSRICNEESSKVCLVSRCGCAWTAGASVARDHHVHVVQGAWSRICPAQTDHSIAQRAPSLRAVRREESGAAAAPPRPHPLHLFPSLSAVSYYILTQSGSSSRLPSHPPWTCALRRQW